MSYALFLGATQRNFAVTVGELPVYWDQTQARGQHRSLEGFLTSSPIVEIKVFEQEMNEVHPFLGMHFYFAVRAMKIQISRHGEAAQAR
jgi:hypothetical protein